jgi:hypothetical protein
MKQWAEAVVGLPGVRGDSAQGQISQGTWEARQWGSAAKRCNGRREQITAGGLLPGVGEAHSSEEARYCGGSEGALLETS